MACGLSRHLMPPPTCSPVFRHLQVEVGSAEEAHAVLRRGSRQRQRAETGLNYSSSRSHSIFTVRVCLVAAARATWGEGRPHGHMGEGVRPAGLPRSSTPTPPPCALCCLQITLYQEAPEGHCSQEGGEDGCEEKLGRMSFVDLAGSERAQRTGNVGVRLKWVLRVVEGRGLGGAAAAPLCCPFCCVVLPLSCFRKSSPCFARPGTCPAGATLQAAPAPCSLLLQGERGHQQQPDDAGAVPGGAAVEPAAPRQGAGQPAGGALPREQGHPPVQVGGVGAASWGLACFAFWTTKGKDWLGTYSDYALLLLRMQLHPLAVLCRSTRSSPPACPPPPTHTHTPPPPPPPYIPAQGRAARLGPGRSQRQRVAGVQRLRRDGARAQGGW